MQNQKEAISSPDTDHEMYLQKEWINSYIDKEYPFEYPQEDRPILTENEDISGNAYDEIQYVCPNRRLAQLKVDYSPDILWTVMQDNCDVQSAEDDIFYRHSDHLGSASWITERHGDAIQYLHYMPYGQLLVNQMPYGYDERYKFTGKERDSETGYDYFGARYYAPLLLHWTTVDPLADKYPGISPYAYCNWNPIKFVDPDGRGVFPNAEALRQAGESVVNNPQYWPTKYTYCNKGAQAINALTGDNSVQGLANEMGAFLRNPQNATALSQSEALEYANMGVVVFASYISNGSEPGHIAVVAPTESLSYSPSRNESVVSVFNIGRINKEMTLTKAFGTRPVDLFILNDDLKTINERMTTINGGILNEIMVPGQKPNIMNPVKKALEIKLPTIDITL